VFDAVVEQIESGKVTGERLYRVKYSDGDTEHLTAKQVKECCAPDDGQSRIRQGWNPDDIAGKTSKLPEEAPVQDEQQAMMSQPKRPRTLSHQSPINPQR